jgi:hypothetical protein
MAYYKVRIEVWCDWNPAESDLDDIAQAISVGKAICTKREVVAVVDRPQDIEDEEAMSFFGGSEGDADESQGYGVYRQIRLSVLVEWQALRPTTLQNLPRGVFRVPPFFKIRLSLGYVR